MSWLTDLRGKKIRVNGTPTPDREELEFEGGFTSTDDPITGRTKVTMRVAPSDLEAIDDNKVIMNASGASATPEARAPNDQRFVNGTKVTKAAPFPDLAAMRTEMSAVGFSLTHITGPDGDPWELRTAASSVTDNDGARITADGNPSTTYFERKRGREVDPTWWGLSVDDVGGLVNSAALQSAIAYAAEVGGIVAVPPGTFNLGATVLFDQLCGQGFRGAGMSRIFTQSGGTRLNWVGASDGVMFRVRESRYCDFSDFEMFSSSSFPALTAIELLRDGEASPSTSNTFSRIRIDGGGGYMPNPITIITSGADANNDFHVFDYVFAVNYGDIVGNLGTAQGAGVRAALYVPQTQSKGINLTNCFFGGGSTRGHGADHGVWARGVVHWRGGASGYLDVAVFTQMHANEPFTIQGLISEGAEQLLRTTTTSGNISVSVLDCVFATDLMVDDKVILYGGGGSLTVSNLQIRGAAKDVYINLKNHTGAPRALITGCGFNPLTQTTNRELLSFDGTTLLPPDYRVEMRATSIGSALVPDYVTTQPAHIVESLERPAADAGETAYCAVSGLFLQNNGTEWVTQRGGAADVSGMVSAILGANLYAMWTAEETELNDAGAFRLPDLSGNLRHLDDTGAVGGFTTITDSELNDRAVVVFDGVGQYLETITGGSDWAFLHDGKEDSAVILVTHCPAPGTNKWLWGTTPNISTGTGVHGYFNDGSARWEHAVGNGGSAIMGHYAAYSSPMGPLLVSCETRRASNAIANATVIADGNENNGGTHTFSGYSTSAADNPLTIFRRPGVATYLGGNFAFGCVARGATQRQLAQIYAVLRSSYGVN